MGIPATLALCAAVVVAAKTVAWLLQRRHGNGGIVDAIWAWSLGALAVIITVAGDGSEPTRLAIGLMGGVWGLRLGTHLWRRNWGAREDFRYAAFREQWGARAQRNMFWFFQFQNVFTLLLAASAFVPAAFSGRTPPAAAFVLAGALWLVAVVGEAVADAQMKAFRANPANKNRVCRDGLWGWSRHPNYFFETVHWVAYVPLALFAPWGWVSLAAPVVMGFLLLKVSGMPLLEAEMMRRKPGYADYVARTSALVPWPPRRNGDAA